MIQIFTALSLFAQVVVNPITVPQMVPEIAYVLDYAPAQGGQMLLVRKDGRYLIDMGDDCNEITAPVNVAYLPGSGGVAAIEPNGSDQVCNIYIEAPISNIPCMTTDDLCDVSKETGT